MNSKDFVCRNDFDLKFKRKEFKVRGWDDRLFLSSKPIRHRAEKLLICCRHVPPGVAAFLSAR